MPKYARFPCGRPTQLFVVLFFFYLLNVKIFRSNEMTVAFSYLRFVVPIFNFERVFPAIECGIQVRVFVNIIIIAPCILCHSMFFRSQRIPLLLLFAIVNCNWTLKIWSLISTQSMKYMFNCECECMCAVVIINYVNECLMNSVQWI